MSQSWTTSPVFLRRMRTTCVLASIVVPREQLCIFSSVSVQRAVGRVHQNPPGYILRVEVNPLPVSDNSSLPEYYNEFSPPYLMLHSPLSPQERLQQYAHLCLYLRFAV